MAHLKLVVLLAVMLTTNPANQKIDPLSCHGPDTSPSVFYQARIDESLKLFSTKPKITKPEFLVRHAGTRCHNTWADILRNRVIISEPIFRDFSSEELAGLIAHEIAHIELRDKGPHIQMDLRGAELTSTSIMLAKLKRMLSICIDLKKTKGLTYSILHNLEWEIEDYRFRISKIKSQSSTESPK